MVPVACFYVCTLGIKPTSQAGRSQQDDFAYKQESYKEFHCHCNILLTKKKKDKQKNTTETKKPPTQTEKKNQSRCSTIFLPYITHISLIYSSLQGNGIILKKILAFLLEIQRIPAGKTAGWSSSASQIQHTSHVSHSSFSPASYSSRTRFAASFQIQLRGGVCIRISAFPVRSSHRNCEQLYRLCPADTESHGSFAMFS